MTDTTFTDLGPFFQRHDQRTRLVSVAALSASLVLSAVILARLMLDPGRTLPKLVPVMWGLGVLFTPVFIAGWWGYTEFMSRGRRRSAQPDGRHPAGPDDARNGVRVANGGFVFHLGVNASVVLQQAVMALMAFGYPTGDLIPRATCVVVGGVTLYLGNLWPRMPVARTPERAAAVRMQANRWVGWMMVVFGLLILLLGLFLPVLEPHRWPLPRP
jgi:hypothetical protein